MAKFKEKLKNIGPGALVAAAFIGPGTVTTCTVSGASYGYTLYAVMGDAVFYNRDDCFSGNGRAARRRDAAGAWREYQKFF